MLLLLFRLLLAASAGGSAVASATRPNLVLILADDLGYGDLSVQGGEIRTPHLDSLARDGARFEAFYAAAPVCTPSRYGLLTGRHPVRSADQLLSPLMFLQPRDDRRGLRSHEVSLARVLRDRGYHTALIGKWHLGHGETGFLPRQHGFDYTYGCHGGAIDFLTRRYGDKPDWFRQGEPVVEEGYVTDLLTDEAVKWLRARRQAEPFFLYLAHTAPHYGKGWDPATRQPTNILQAKPADRDRNSHVADARRREYAGMVSALDDGVGRVLAALREANLDANTLVIFTSDNGGDLDYGGHNGALRGEKSQLFEGGIRVPCLMRWPGQIAPGRIIREAATGLDVFPTCAELAGADVRPLYLDGTSLAPLLRGHPGPDGGRALFWATPRTGAVRRGAWKYVADAGRDHLFHLERDPRESNDLAAAEPTRLAALRELYNTWRRDATPAR